MSPPPDQKKQDNRLWEALQEQAEQLQASEPYIAKRIDHWLKRFAFHEQLHQDDPPAHRDPALKKLLRWRKKATHEAKQLEAALEAWLELHKKIDKTKDHHKDWQLEVLLVIYKKMFKLEIMQLRLLQKAQHMPRHLEDDVDLDKLNDELASVRNRLNNWEMFKKLHRPVPHSQLKGEPLQKTTLFLHQRSRRIRLKPILNTASRTSSTVEVGNAITTLVAHIIEISQGLLPIVQAIPFVNAFAAAIPVLIRTAKAFIKKQSAAKKKWGFALTCIVAASISLMFLTVAGLGFVFIGAMAAGLTALGTWIKYIDPFIKQRKKLKNKEAEYQLCQAIHKAILKGEDPLTILGAPSFIQAYLFSRAEEQWVSGKIDDKKRDALIDKIKQIHAEKGQFESLQEDEEISHLCGDRSLMKALKKALPQYEKSYKALIPALQASKNRSQAYAITGCINFLGVILLLVPTPPTLILGATLLLIGSISGLVLSFEIDIKIRRAFSRQPEKTAEPVSAPPPLNLHAELRGTHVTQRPPQSTVISQRASKVTMPTPPLSSSPPTEDNQEPQDGKKPSS